MNVIHAERKAKRKSHLNKSIKCNYCLDSIVVKTVILSTLTLQFKISQSNYSNE